MKSKSTLLLLSLALTGVLFTGCKHSNKQTILSPIEENAIGRWSLNKSYEQTDGEWVEYAPSSNSIQLIILNHDGNATIVLTEPDGSITSDAKTWSVDEDAKTITIGKSTSQVFSLTDTGLEISFNEAIDPESDNAVVDGNYRWALVRSDDAPKHLIETLVGKWSLDNTYENVDGEWMPATTGVTDVSHFEYKEDGTSTYYSLVDNIEHTYDLEWHSNSEGNTITWILYDQPLTVGAKFVSNDTLNLFYTTNFNNLTGEIVSGQFKDVLVRDK